MCNDTLSAHVRSDQLQHRVAQFLSRARYPVKRLRGICVCDVEMYTLEMLCAIIAILKQGEAGLTTAELCRQHGMTEQTYYRWKAKYGGMDSSEAKKLKQLEEENRKLTQESEYRKAIELNPNDAISHHWYSNLLQNLARPKEALVENERALALDPASPQINANHASILSDLRRNDEAMSEFNRLIASNPDFPVYYAFRGFLNWRLGNQDAYVADAVMAMKKGGREDLANTFAVGYQKAKLQGACLAAIQSLKARSRQEYVSPYEIATFYALMQDRERTFEWLEKAYAERSVSMEYLKTDYFLQPFRSDPRYINLLQRMNMN